MQAANRLLETWSTPYGMPPFSTIKDDNFMPAFQETMRLHRAEIDTISADPATPTFANTIEALERTGKALTQVGTVFWNLNSTVSNDALQQIEREISPQLANHQMAIKTNKALFARVEALFEQSSALGLTEEQTQLLDRYYKSFVRSGVKLDEAGTRRATAITERLAELYTVFSQNILSDEKSFLLILEKLADLAGLPDFVVQSAFHTAEERGYPGKHAITLQRSSVEPFLQFSTRRDLREKAYKGYIERGQMSAATDTRKLIAEILSLRQERAKLLGYETYADFRLDDVMAKTPANARRLLENVWTPAKRKADEERDALQKIAQSEGHNEPLAAWDWHHLTEVRRKAEFDIDSAALKPYFQLENMIAAAFDTAHRLFGITFTERHDIPVYHPDVRVWEAKDRHGGPIGLFVGDYFQRANKRSNAWMSCFRKQQRLDGDVLPIIINVMNFTKGSSGKPSLLSFDDARTLFHEFGHGLHGLLSQVTYPSLSGTAVDRDLVELPSQLYENWLLQRETLARFALHAETGEPIPPAIVDRVIAATTFNQGFATAEYVASALFDLDAHEATDVEHMDVNAFEANMRAKMGMPDEIALRHRPTHFQHVFTGEGYAAGYYTYLWAEVMEADAFHAFEETGNLYDKETAERLYKYVYSAGAKMKPDEAYRAFRGKDPSIEPLLEKRGLTA